MSKSHSYRDLIVWKKSIGLVTEIYWITKIFPKDDMFWLTSQIRRAAVSIPSNIAEWQSRNWSNEFLHFLWIAEGSLAELETQIIIANNVVYLEDKKKNEHIEKTEEIRQILFALKKSLRAPITPNSKLKT